MRIIKRYPNRKLYDLASKRYVTLVDVTALVQQDIDFQVLEHPSERDITTQVLSQIVVDLAKTQGKALSIALLRGLIQAKGNALTFLTRAMGLGAWDSVEAKPAPAHLSLQHLLQQVATAADAQRLETQLIALEQQLERRIRREKGPPD